METQSNTNKVLVVDDEKSVCSSLKEFLEFESFLVETAYDGEDALMKLDSFKPDVVLLDIRMPNLNGVEALGMIKMRKPDVQIIMVSAVQNANIEEKCLKHGAFAYLLKPIKLDELLETVRRALENKRNPQTEFLAEPPPAPESASRSLDEDSESIISFLNDEIYNSLKFCLDVLEYSDPVLAWHSKNVAWLSAGTAKELGLGNIRTIELAALLHDIGKIPLKSQLPHVPAKEMSPQQQKLFNRYPIFGQEIIQTHSHIGGLGKIIRHQCEQVDGNGFPDGLSGSEIPIASKIIHVANTFDEMLDLDSAGNIQVDIAETNLDLPFKVLEREAGKRFDVGVISGLNQFLDKYRSNPRREFGIQLDQLKAGMVLSRDVIGGNGKPILIKETTLTNSQVEELQEIKELHLINTKLRVYQ